LLRSASLRQGASEGQNLAESRRGFTKGEIIKNELKIRKFLMLHCLVVETWTLGFD